MEERLELISVVLLGVGALLIANPAFLGAHKAPGSVVIEATPQEQSVGEIPSLAAGSDAVVYNPNVTEWETLTPPERTLVDSAQGTPGVRITRDQYQEIYANASEFTYLRPNGHLHRNGSLLRPRFTRARQGLGFRVESLDDRIVVAEIGHLHDDVAADARDAIDAPVSLANASVQLTAYDYLVEDELYAPVTENASTPNGTATLRLETAEPSVILDALSVPIEEVRRPQRSMVRRAIDEGSYDTGNVSVGGLRGVSMVRADGAYYTIALRTEPPGFVEMFETIHIVGMLLGLVFLLSGLYYAREVYRERTAEWPE